MGKIHKSIRLEEELAERLEALRFEEEPLSNAIERILAIGCDALESAAAQGEEEPGEAQDGANEYLRELVDNLKEEITRLRSEHEADRAVIAAKDKQLADALEKAHELTSQAHYIAMAASKVSLPGVIDAAAEAAEEGRTVEVEQPYREEQPAQAEQESKAAERRGIFARIFGGR